MKPPTSWQLKRLACSRSEVAGSFHSLVRCKQVLLVSCTCFVDIWAGQMQREQTLSFAVLMDD